MDVRLLRGLLIVLEKGELPDPKHFLTILAIKIDIGKANFYL